MEKNNQKVSTDQAIIERVDQIRQELLRLEVMSLEQMKSEPHRFYVPICKTEEWLDKFGSTNYFTTFFSGANGVGKTTVLANVVAHLCFPVDNKFFQQKLFTDYPYPLKNIRIISNPNTLNETLIPALKFWLPDGRYTTEKKGKHYDYIWKTDTGWQITILTYDQPVEAFESANVSIILFDEPPPEHIYKANVSRLRRGGQIGILATPLKGSAWMYDAIVTSDDPNVAYVEAEVEDACIEHGCRGFLEHKDILKMISQYSAEDMQARIFGRFQHLVGLVFKEFKREIHVIKSFKINPRDYLVVQSIDTHPRNEDAVVWVAIDRKGRHFVIDELYMHGTISELAEQIRRRDLEYNTREWLIEPAASINDQHFEGRSVKTDLELALGVEYQLASKARSQAIQLLHDMLHYQQVGDEFVVEPMLYFFDTCKRSIWEFEHWKYVEYSGKTAEKKGQSEKPEDKNDHMIEAIGRVILAGFEFREYIPVAPAGQVRSQSDLDPY